jgi:hypothetical protein
MRMHTKSITPCATLPLSESEHLSSSGPPSGNRGIPHSAWRQRTRARHRVAGAGRRSQASPDASGRRLEGGETHLNTLRWWCGLRHCLRSPLFRSTRPVVLPWPEKMPKRRGQRGSPRPKFSGGYPSIRGKGEHGRNKLHSPIRRTTVHQSPSIPPPITAYHASTLPKQTWTSTER